MTARKISKNNPQSKQNTLRMTRQRKEVYDILMSERNHPTANEVYDRAKARNSGISLATVYNCLEVLVNHDLVRQVNFDREPTRYCPNIEEHGHFHDTNTGIIHDVVFKKGVCLSDVLDLPPGTRIENMEITLRGSYGSQ